MTDTGIGLTEEQITRLFSLFHQADSSTTRKYGGTGLGLAIAKQLAELMGGEVGVRSEYASGSTFWAIVRLGVSHSSRGDSHSKKPVVEPALKQRRLDGAQILVAEDNLLNQQVAQEMLEGMGATVTLALDGREAVELASSCHYDCILMDVRMPEMDGLQATLALRGMAATRSLPIIAMTANAMVADREECLRIGMNDFISKPVNPDQLLMTLGKWILPEHTSPDLVDAVIVEPPTTPRRLPTSNSSHINLDEFNALCKNNTNRVLKLVSIFFDSGRKGLEEMRQAHLAEDQFSLSQIGHRLKSSSRYIGAHVLADLWHDLEATAKAGQVERISATVDLLEKEWLQVEQELISIVDSDSAVEHLHS